MKVKHHRDLQTWQLADEIRRAFFELTSRPGVKRDFSFCDQTKRAARSACRNIAEGFWRFDHPVFAQFVLISKGSLGELIDSADEALQQRYVDRAEYDVLIGLLNRGLAAATGLHAYLSTTPTPTVRRIVRPKHRTGPDAPHPAPSTRT